MAKRDSVNQKPAGAWQNRIARGKEAKSGFNEWSETALQFFHGGGNLQDLALRLGVLPANATLSPPEWQHRTNLMYEFVRIYGAALIHRNPQRMVNARNVLPTDALFSEILEDYLNYTPHEMGFKRHLRRATDEAILKGASLLTTGLDERTGLVGSFWTSIDNLLIDPNVNNREDITWSAIRRQEPLDVLRERFGDSALRDIRPQKPLLDTLSAQNVGHQQDHSQTNEDIVTYWEIFSRRGIADKMAPKETGARGERFNTQEAVYILMSTDGRIFHIGDWPVPFFADNRWPWSMVVFNDVPNQLWPDTLLRPVMSEVLFDNWATGFVMQKLAFTSKLVVAVAQHGPDEVEAKLKEQGPIAVLNLPFHDGNNLSALVDTLSMPSDIGDMMAFMSRNDEKLQRRLGLADILFGQTSTQFRSAQEAAIKDRNSRLRIDDLADIVEDWQTEVARKEALAARWLLTPDDIDALPVVGGRFRLDLAQSGITPGQIWGRYNEGDLRRIAREFEYRIAAGSIRKPNKELQVDKVANLFRDIAPMVVPFAQAGITGPLNQLILAYAEANEIENPERFLIDLQPEAPQGAPAQAAGQPAGRPLAGGALGSEQLPGVQPPAAAPPAPPPPGVIGG